CRSQIVACVDFIVVETQARARAEWNRTAARIVYRRYVLQLRFREYETDGTRAERVVQSSTKRSLHAGRKLSVRAGARCSASVPRDNGGVKRVGVTVIQLQVRRGELQRTIAIRRAETVRAVVGEPAGLVREAIKAF